MCGAIGSTRHTGACNAENVVQKLVAWDQIDRQYRQGYGHDYQKVWKLLDVDMTGRPCGKKAAFASKGYFAKQRNRQGSQEVVLTSDRYQSVGDVDQYGALFNRQLRDWPRP